MASRSYYLLAVAVVAVASAACTEQKGQVPMVKSAELHSDLKRVSQARVLFGHQSVGRDVLAGLQSLSIEAGVPVRVQEIDGVPPDEAPGLFHANIGKNGDPESKCEVFASLLNRPERPDYDLAMMKFCYVDLGRDTPIETAAMLDRYSRLVSDLRAQRSDVTLVHVSMPLRSDPPGIKTYIKRFLDRSTDEDADNILRNAFNQGLRERFSREPFFDIAAFESTSPDGSRSSFMADGKVVHTLAPQYTNDGGHLNEEAQRRVAAEFVRVLAAALPEN